MYIEPHYDGTRVSFLTPVGGGSGDSAVELSKKNAFFIGIAAATGGAVAIQTVDSFTINDDPAYISQILGTATFLGGTSYSLTQNANNQVGVIWNENRVFGGFFNVSFNYQIGGSSAADGFSLIFCPTYFLAAAGGGLGYEGAPSNSVAIEIDIFKNPSDPDNSHIAVLKGGNVNDHLALSSVTVRPGGNLSVSYGQKTLRVFHNGNLIITYPIDLISIIGE